MAVKRKMHRRYGKRKIRTRQKAYQVVVKEGTSATRPLKGMRLFDSKREGAAALRILATYQDDATKFKLRTVRV